MIKKIKEWWNKPRYPKIVEKSTHHYDLEKLRNLPTKEVYEGNYKKYIGKIVDIKMKPIFLREWKVLRDSGKCLVITKELYNGSNYVAENHLPKKQILGVKKL